MKKCSKCNKKKEISCFGKNMSRSDGLQYWCKLCRKLNYKNYYANNKKKESLRKKEYYKKNKDKVLKRNQLYVLKNKSKRLKYIRIYAENRKKNDIEYKIKYDLRIRVNKALKNNQKSGSAVRDLGCFVEELKSYLESQFVDDMSWENHGLHGWHIDHIKPLSAFDLTDRKQFLEACHYTNLQPLWAEDNWCKGGKILDG